MKNKTTSWVEEFDERFKLESESGYEAGVVVERHKTESLNWSHWKEYSDFSPIKSFIEKTLLQQREEILEEVRGMKLEGKYLKSQALGYNQCADDLIAKLKKENI